MFDYLIATEAGATGDEDAGAPSGKPEKRSRKRKASSKDAEFGVTRYATVFYNLRVLGSDI